MVEPIAPVYDKPPAPDSHPTERAEYWLQRTATNIIGKGLAVDEVTYPRAFQRLRVPTALSSLRRFAEAIVELGRAETVSHLPGRDVTGRREVLALVDRAFYLLGKYPDHYESDEELIRLAEAVRDRPIATRVLPDILKEIVSAPCQREPASADIPLLDAPALAILEALARRHPVLMHIPDLIAEVDFQKDTVGKSLNYLIDHGLADRPRGGRTGAIITDGGRAALEKVQKKR